MSDPTPIAVPRAAIFAEIDRRLKLIPGVNEVQRMPYIDPRGFPALHVFDDGHSIQISEAGATRYEMMPSVEGYVEAEGGAEAHDQLLALYAQVVAALIPDPPLGGLAETIDEGTMRVFVAPLASKNRLGFSLDLPITFAANRNDPAIAA